MERHQGNSSRDTCSLSIVIAAYNESQRLPATLERVVTYSDAASGDYEVIVVDDGSTDATAALVKSFSQKYPTVRLISLEKNRGKGAAVRSGVLAAKGELILFCDADGATPISEIARLQQAVTEGADIAIGSRALTSDDVTVDAHLHRLVIGRVFNFFANLLLVPGIADTQCGFKLFKRSIANKIFPLQVEDGFIFDVELLYLARKFSAKVSEVAVDWADQPGSRVKLLRDSWRMFSGLFRIFFRRYAL